MSQRTPDARTGGVLRYLTTRRMALASAVAFLLVSYGLAGEFMRSRAMNRELVKLQAQAAALQAANEEAARKSVASSSAAALEREARLKMNLRKPGEEVVVVRVSDTADTPTTAADPENAAAPNPAKWWYHFFR